MRKVEMAQLEIGGSFIEDVEINPKSRDDIPALLLEVQHLYVVADLRKRLFALLEAEVNPDVRKDTGRRGMDQEFPTLFCDLLRGDFPVADGVVMAVDMMP